ncbi:MAG: NAD(P)/FAD-dependent oxidoreductase [Acidimicrobiia bacterium]|nr:NAD(P)/FAD-dependent oxidoreductase [Acidimicrobiia bacterium]
MRTLPVAVIGAGPVGLAAAAHLARYRQPFVVLEAGSEAVSSIREWAHVRTFSPWRYMVDSASRQLLESTGWRTPDPEKLPTGGELIFEYLAPLSRLAAMAPHIRYRSRVVAVGRKDFDKVRTKGRDGQPFELRLESGEVVDARAVIDASGTWSRPNPAGSGGIAAAGEHEHADRIVYGIPDVLGRDRDRYAGQGVVVVGSGHSAFNVILDLLMLSDQASGTRITWLMRRDNVASVWGGGASDALEARGELGQRVKRAFEAGRIEVVTPFRVRRVSSDRAALLITGTAAVEERTIVADRLIVCTGFRPDVDMLKEIRLGLDPWLESPTALAPLIDPNEHSCGTVRPHGARELAHPEKDFYIAGMKSYGRAPTFLLATGYEQVRSIAAMLAGDIAAAERVELVLPETGVCGTDALAGASSCCGGPAPADVDACCTDDATAKAAGKSGYLCNGEPVALLQVGRPK